MVETKSMNNWEAIKALEEGKKIRQPGWPQDQYIELRGSDIRNQNNNIFWLSNESLATFLACKRMWELYDSRVKFSDILMGQRYSYDEDGIVYTKYKFGHTYAALDEKSLTVYYCAIPENELVYRR